MAKILVSQQLRKLATVIAVIMFTVVEFHSVAGAIPLIFAPYMWQFWMDFLECYKICME